ARRTGRPPALATAAGGAGDVLRLQRLAGNRAVGAALQRGGPAANRPPPVPGAASTPATSAATVGMAPAASTTITPTTIGYAVPAGTAAPVAGVPVQRGLWDTVVGGVTRLAGGVKERALGTLAGWARRVPGYELLCTVLGRDVVAGTPVPRTAAAIVGGFLALMPGGAAMRDNLARSGALERAGAWFEAEVPKLGLTWEAIRGLFQRAWDALGVADVLNPAGAWQKIVGIFGPPLGRLRDFAVAAGGTVLEFIFEAGLALGGSLGGQVMAVIRRAGGVLGQIVRDPIGFAGNLVAAVRGGLGQFLANIGAHLRTGLFGWLTGALRAAVRLPAQLDLRGIVSLALDLLGLTWDNLRGRLVRLIGAPRVALLERGVDLVQQVATRGLSAISDRISTFAGGLVDTVIGGIRDWVANSVVGAALTRLISMFNPAGAVIQAILGVYNTVRFFIERAQQLGAFAESVFDSISAIAGGSVGSAVGAVERALGRSVPVVLGFLARLIGLGDVAAPVRNVVGRARGVIDGALDRVTGWLGGLARRVTGRRNGERPRPPEGAGDPRTPDQKASALRDGLAAAWSVMQRPGATRDAVAAALPDIARQYGLRTLQVLDVGRSFRVEGTVNPKDSTPAIPDVMPVQSAVRALRQGRTEVTVRTREEALRVVREAFPDALERPGSTVGSAYGSSDVARSIARYREDRQRLLLFHVDIGRYRVDEVLPALRAEIDAKQRARDEAVRVMTYVTNQIAERQSRHGGSAPGARVDFQERLVRLQAEADRHDRDIRALRESERDFARQLPAYRDREREGVLYGHETVPGAHPHRTVPHINVEGSRVAVGGGRQSIDVSVYIVEA
ncbi:MAG TPA: hypothetical protein VES42_07735, partial [Pilimelia sp.]|nr:hypothetical protein [Pilimelia sp.]